MEFGALFVELLELVALLLVGGGVGMGGAGEVELFEAGVAFASGAGEEEPGFLFLLVGVEELELGVGAAAESGVGVGGFGSVGVAGDLDEAGAGVYFFAELVAEVAGLGAEDVLPDGFVAFAEEDVGDALAGGSQLAGDGGDEEAGLFHGGGLLVRGGRGGKGWILA